MGFYKTFRRVEPHIGAIAFISGQLTVLIIRIVKIIVSPEVRRLSHSSSLMGNHLRKAPVLGPVRIVIP
mgnify:CR=1 FL=1